MTPVSTEGQTPFSRTCPLQGATQRKFDASSMLPLPE
jgi:hypothetical protein